MTGAGPDQGRDQGRDEGREPGSVAEEAARLFEAVQGWARVAGAALGSAGEHGPGAPCRICPLCQLIALLRDARPEAVEHLADAVGSLTLAARAALEGYADGAARRGDAPRVQRIDVG